MNRPDSHSLPLSPGVYLYKDVRGRVIYVGKARVLRRRVLSYFRTDGLSAKTRALLSHAHSLDWLTTTTEKEALLFEAGLIKKHRPRYNIVLRDDKQYVMFRIDVKQPFPRLEIVRRVRRGRDGTRCFGPFTSALSARETWKLLHRAFPLRRCSDRSMKNRVRPCLYHHIGQCPAPCMGLVTPEAYHDAVHKVCELLQGRSELLLCMLREEMAQAADALEFEKAAILRDQIQAVARTVERQAAVLPGGGDMDAVGLFPADAGLAVGIVFVRGGAVTDGRSFYWAGLTFEDAPELLWSFVGQYYSTLMPPPRVLLPWLPPDRENEWFSTEGVSTPAEEKFFERGLMEQSLSEKRGSPVRIVPPQNARDNQLVDIAASNAREEARRHQKQPVIERLARALRLPEMPRRIECADVSHTAGRETRVGLVVFEYGSPARSQYRSYAMPDSADDCATLHAWAARRLASGPPWPGLLLIDGGRGQLAAVQRALAEAGQDALFPLAAIVKARDEHGRADRRAGNVRDRIFIPGRANPLSLRDGASELLFLQHVRDTAHSFAVGRHRRARDAAALSSELMRLPGIGPVTARLLWKKFASVGAMRSATLDDLQGLPSIGRVKATELLQKLQTLHW